MCPRSRVDQRRALAHQQFARAMAHQFRLVLEAHRTPDEPSVTAACEASQIAAASAASVLLRRT